MHGLVFFMQKQLISLAEIVAGLPHIPHHLLIKSPQPALAHTALHTVRVRQAELSGLRCSDDFHLEEGVGGTLSSEPEPELEPAYVRGQPQPEPESRQASSGEVLPKGAILIKINNEPCITEGGRVGKARIDEITAGVAPDDWNVVTYVESDRLIADYRADIIQWLLPQNLHSEYLAERTRFMRHRRAAEMVAIVFGDQLRAAGDAEYEKFDCQNERPLVRLGAYRTTAIEPEYKGPGLSAPVEVPAQAFVPLLGFCSTPGCDKPHDAYCDPCGHAVCCWACLGAQRTCPVCNVVITDRSLCYPANTLELEATRQEETQKGMGVGSSVAPVAKKYMLTHQELSAKKQQNKQVVQCMAQGCNAQLVSGQKHHCRCCGIKVCAQTRQALSPSPFISSY